jgi:hypothetical protein
MNCNKKPTGLCGLFFRGVSRCLRGNSEVVLALVAKLSHTHKHVSNLVTTANTSNLTIDSGRVTGNMNFRLRKR